MRKIDCLRLHRAQLLEGDAKGVSTQDRVNKARRFVIELLTSFFRVCAEVVSLRLVRANFLEWTVKRVLKVQRLHSKSSSFLSSQTKRPTN